MIAARALSPLRGARERTAFAARSCTAYDAGTMTGISLLTTDGDAYACGLAHGRRFAREIADNVATYLRRFAASGLHRDAAFAEAARWRKAIAAHNGAYAEEMQGIADGSGQGEDIIALLNARAPSCCAHGARATELRVPHRSRDRRRENGCQRMRHRPRRKWPRLEQ